jgi:hypothetical protein
MAPEAAYGSLDPNSGNQRWSRWRFVVEPGRRLPSAREVRDNWQRYIPKLFRTNVGRGKAERVKLKGRVFYALSAEVEGAPVHDPGYVSSVRREMSEKGFGVGARLRDMDAALLAGDAEDGKPRAQLLVLPAAIL